MQKGDEVRKSLEYSVMDGIFTSIAGNLAIAYLVPFVLAIGFSARDIALLNGTNIFFSTIGLILGIILMKKISKKKIVVAGTLFLSTLHSTF